MLQCPVLTSSGEHAAMLCAISDLVLDTMHRLVGHMDHANAVRAAVVLEDLSLPSVSWNLWSGTCFASVDTCMWCSNGKPVLDCRQAQEPYAFRVVCLQL